MNEGATIIELEEFLTWLTVERGRAESAVSGYRRDVANFLDWLDLSEEQLLTAQESGITAYVAHKTC